MPRNMSFSLTTEQARNKTKTVTRRLGWGFLKPGDVVQQVEKAQGLKKGEKVKKIHLIRIVDTRKEYIGEMGLFPSYGMDECVKEGFPGMLPVAFVEMFCRHNRCGWAARVNRIEFEYLEDGQNG